MLKIIKVAGESLSPEYQTGDYVLLTTPTRLNRLKPGDVIVFLHEAYGQMIKRIERMASDGLQIFVVGTHSRSIDSTAFGPISPDSIIGKVIWHVAKSRRYSFSEKDFDSDRDQDGGF